MSSYYCPKDGWAGDWIPFYWEGEFRLFYLHDYRGMNGETEGTPWRQVRTTDFVHFEELGEMIARGTRDEQDLYAYTGCVVRAEEMFHIFYTGHNPYFREQGKPTQAVMHAVSDDLLHWEKQPSDMLYAPVELGYDAHDWRDPFVFHDETDGLWHMLLAARLIGKNAVRCGCTAHCVSRDLMNWKTVEPLWNPELYFTHECPDFFKLGDWYYLIFSEFSDCCKTRYVKSKGLYGPWEAPVDDMFDTRAYYAAKSFSNGDKRYLFGWNPTRIQNSDDQKFAWGGNLVVHELYQLGDGTLAVREPSTIQKMHTLEKITDDFELSCPDGYAEHIVAGALGESYRLSFDVKFKTPPQGFGIRVRLDTNDDSSYGVRFDVNHHIITFEQMPNRAWGHMEDTGLWRHCVVQAKEWTHLDIIVDDTLFLMYVNDQTAFSARMYDYRGKELALFVRHGVAEFAHITLYPKQR
ncbi:MAG: glycoside hydrolase family 32 protein [Raoultibacter sp.]